MEEDGCTLQPLNTVAITGLYIETRQLNHMKSTEKTENQSSLDDNMNFNYFFNMCQSREHIPRVFYRSARADDVSKQLTVAGQTEKRYTFTKPFLYSAKRQ